MKKSELFEKMHTGYVSGKNPLLSNDQDEINEKLVDILSDEYGYLIDFCYVEELMVLGILPY